jgi:hypothetical protein
MVSSCRSTTQRRCRASSCHTRRSARRTGKANATRPWRCCPCACTSDSRTSCPPQSCECGAGSVSLPCCLLAIQPEREAPVDDDEPPHQNHSSHDAFKQHDYSYRNSQRVYTRFMKMERATTSSSFFMFVLVCRQHAERVEGTLTPNSLASSCNRRFSCTPHPRCTVYKRSPEKHGHGGRSRTCKCVGASCSTLRHYTLMLASTYSATP